MKELIDKLNKCFLNNGNARHIDYDGAEKILNQFKSEVCKKQRYECQVEIDKDSIQIDGKWYVSCEDVLNATEPD